MLPHFFAQSCTKTALCIVQFCFKKPHSIECIFVKNTFEVGGKKKKHRQIQDIANGYMSKDDIETGYGNIIPLWMFGMLY